MKHLLLFITFCSIIQCSSDPNEVGVQLELKLMGADDTDKLVFDENESIFFFIEITNLSPDQTITWQIVDSDWNQFDMKKADDSSFNWFADDTGLCPASGYDLSPVVIDASTTCRFPISGRGICRYGQPRSEWLSAGNYTFVHDSDYIFTRSSDNEAFSVDIDVKRNFVVE